MKKKFALFFLLISFFSFFYIAGIFYDIRVLKKGNAEARAFTIQESLEICHPVIDDKQIVSIALVHKYDTSLERLLDSICMQTYPHTHLILIDNGSKDNSVDKARKHIQEYAKKRSVEWISCEKKRSDLEVLFEVIHTLSPEDVVVFLNENNWLAHEHVFDYLNAAYANPNVWMTYSRSMGYPNFEISEEGAFSDDYLIQKKLRQAKHWNVPGLKSFYAGLFQEIKLQDLLFEGRFIEHQVEKALLTPMFEMGPKNLLFLNEVSYVVNHSKREYQHKEHLKKVRASDLYLSSLPSYATLNQINKVPSKLLSHRFQADIVLFSEDSPLQLYACLESIYLKLSDVKTVSVLYQGSNSEFDRAYLNLKSEFPKVSFLNVCDYPGHDFGSFLTSVFKNQREGSPYILLADDQIIFDEKIDLHLCVQEMKRVHSDYFFFSLEGMIHNQSSPPDALLMKKGIYAWQIGESSPPFGVILCNKNIFDLKLSQAIPDFTLFKEHFCAQLSSRNVGLFYEERKTLTIPPLVTFTAEQKKEWGHKFIEGYKIDLSALDCEREEVIQGDYPLIKRSGKISRQL